MQLEQKDLKDCMSIYHPNCLLDDRLKALINDIIPFFTQVEVRTQNIKSFSYLEIEILIKQSYFVSKAMEQEITFTLFKQLWKDYRLLYLTSVSNMPADHKHE